MRKIIFWILVVMVILAAGTEVYYYFNGYKNSASDIGRAVPILANKDVNPYPAERILTSPDYTGTLTPTADGKAQVYTNKNLGIQMTVPKNWVLADVFDKNIIYFKDPIDAAAYLSAHKEYGVTQPGQWVNDYPIFQIDYYDDFQTWIRNAEVDLGNPDCKMIRDCFDGSDGDQIYDINLNGVTALRVISEGGEETVVETYVEHNGLYSLAYEPGPVDSPFDVINTLKFIK